MVVVVGVEMIVVDNDAVVEVAACLQEAGKTSSSLQGVQMAVDVDLDGVVLGDNEMDDKVVTYPWDDVQMLVANADDAVLPVAAYPSMEVDDEAYPRS